MWYAVQYYGQEGEIRYGPFQSKKEAEDYAWDDLKVVYYQ